MSNIDTDGSINPGFMNLASLIKLKNGPRVLFSPVTQVQTDTDTFPYQRYFRGDPYSPVPIVHSRKAGWCPRQDKCYKEVRIDDATSYYPNHCFQTAPSTVYPCYPEYLRKYSDKDELDLQQFKKNVLEYR